jgi:hypothetical protein
MIRMSAIRKLHSLQSEEMRICATLAFWCIVGNSLSGPVAGQSQPPAPATACQIATGDAPCEDWLFPIGILNRALPSWLKFGGEYRTRLESQDGIRYTSTQDLYLLSRFRLNVTINPTDWLSLVGEAQDSRNFFDHYIPNTPPYQNTWDLRQAYLKLGSSESRVGVIGGRLVLSFGDERVIGPSDWLNTGRTFDAVRLDVRHAESNVSLFASSVVVNRAGVFVHHMQGNNLYGAYGSLQRAIPMASVEPYVLWRVAPSNMVLTASTIPGRLSEFTIGVRVAGTLPAAIDYDVEMDQQRGSVGADSIDAWAGYWGVGRTFRSLSITPRIFIESNYASGTKDLARHTWSTFDQIYPSNHDKLDFADQVGRRNIHQVRAGIEESVRKKWKFRQAYVDLWLATTHDALYASNGAVSIAADPAAHSRHVGQELDLTGECQWHTGITTGFGYARLFAGRLLKTVSPGKDYSYPYIYVTYRF